MYMRCCATPGVRGIKPAMDGKSTTLDVSADNACIAYWSLSLLHLKSVSVLTLAHMPPPIYAAAAATPFTASQTPHENSGNR